MAIIEDIAPHLPLSQGDLLRDVRLFVTEEAWADTGGEPFEAKVKMCLVLSRPCVVGHKSNIIVSAVARHADRVPRSVESFEAIDAFLRSLRDAPDAPDVFYLGQLPGQDGRFSARLDSLYTIQLPTKEETLRRFVAERRIGRLAIDFSRDLHLRIFRAFASLGFDDHRWLSTDDLRWLVARGRSEVASAEAALRSAEAALHSGQAQGFKNEGEKQQLEKAASTARTALDQLRARIAPFEAVLVEREAGATT